MQNKWPRTSHNAGTIKRHAAEFAARGWTVGVRIRPHVAPSGRKAHVLCWGKTHEEVAKLILG